MHNLHAESMRPDEIMNIKPHPFLGDLAFLLGTCWTAFDGGRGVGLRTHSFVRGEPAADLYSFLRSVFLYIEEFGSDEYDTVKGYSPDLQGINYK